MKINSKTKRNLKVALQMSRSSDDKFYLRVEDESSGLLMLEVIMDNDGFANLLSTRTARNQQADYYHNDSIGKKLEHKTILVPLKDASRENMEGLYKRVDKENEGWTCDRDSYNNHNYNHTTKLYSVILRRYV